MGVEQGCDGRKPAWSAAAPDVRVRQRNAATYLQHPAFLYVFGRPEGPCKVGVTNNTRSRARSIVAYLPGATLGRGGSMLWQSGPIDRGLAEECEKAALTALAGTETRPNQLPWQRWRTEWFSITAEAALATLQRTLEGAGVEFIAPNGEGAGVRRKKPGTSDTGG